MLVGELVEDRAQRCQLLGLPAPKVVEQQLGRAVGDLHLLRGQRQFHAAGRVGWRPEMLDDFVGQAADDRLVGLVGDQQTEGAGGDADLLAVQQEVVGGLFLSAGHQRTSSSSRSGSTSTGPAAFSRMLRETRPPAAASSMPRIAVTTASSGGKLPSET